MDTINMLLYGAVATSLAVIIGAFIWFLIDWVLDKDDDF